GPFAAKLGLRDRLHQNCGEPPAKSCDTSSRRLQNHHADERPKPSGILAAGPPSPYLSSGRQVFIQAPIIICKMWTASLGRVTEQCGGGRRVLASGLHLRRGPAKPVWAESTIGPMIWVRNLPLPRGPISRVGRLAAGPRHGLQGLFLRKTPIWYENWRVDG